MLGDYLPALLSRERSIWVIEHTHSLGVVVLGATLLLALGGLLVASWWKDARLDRVWCERCQAYHKLSDL